MNTLEGGIRIAHSLVDFRVRVTADNQLLKEEWERKAVPCARSKCTGLQGLRSAFLILSNDAEDIVHKLGNVQARHDFWERPRRESDRFRVAAALKRESFGMQRLLRGRTVVGYTWLFLELRCQQTSERLYVVLAYMGTRRFEREMAFRDSGPSGCNQDPRKMDTAVVPSRTNDQTAHQGAVTENVSTFHIGTVRWRKGMRFRHSALTRCNQDAPNTVPAGAPSRTTILPQSGELLQDTGQRPKRDASRNMVRSVASSRTDDPTANGGTVTRYR